MENEKKTPRKFFGIPRIDRSKPPLKPKQAIFLSVVALIVVPAGTIISFIFLPYPLLVIILCGALALYIGVSISWSFLDWETRNASIRGHNAFVIFALVIVIVAIFTTKQGESFPKWGIVLIIIAAIAGYSVMGFCAVKNFAKWLRGEFNS